MSRVAVQFAAAGTRDAGSHDAPLLGDGTVEIRPDGVRFQGRRTRQTAATVFGVVAGVLGVIGAAILLDLAGVPPSKRAAFAAGMLAGIAPGIAVYAVLHRTLRGAGADVLVPWSALRVLDASGGRTVVRLVAPELRGDLAIVAKDPAAAAALAALQGTHLHR